MSTLFLELYSEEIPSLVQSEDYINRSLSFFLLDYGVIYSKIQVFIGPCRICIHIELMEDKVLHEGTKIKGPKTSVKQEIINKFCEKYNISTDQLVIEKQKGHDYYFYLQDSFFKNAKDVLVDIIPKWILSFTWPKSMKWSNYKMNWVRPLKNILCLFNNNILPIKVGHLESNNITFGHKFISNKAIKINSFEQYKDVLEKNYVLLSKANRKTSILNQLEQICKKHNLSLLHDDDLLEEVIGLVEYPQVLAGNIPDVFLDKLPQETLVTSMKSHQRYFTTVQGNKIGNKFLFANNNPKGNIDLIISGNEKVLSARLSDALYFYQNDLNTSESEYIKKLQKLIFHDKLGSMYDKSLRLVKLIQHFSDDSDLIHAAKICKYDLVSETVGEFPELQGLIGRYICSRFCNQNTAEIIANHYLSYPLGKIPDSAHILALVDKVDSLVGLYVAGERATGSKDPYGLRRYNASILNIICYSQKNFHLKELIQYSLSIYQNNDNNTSIFEEIERFIIEKLKHSIFEKIEKYILDAFISNIDNLWANVKKVNSLHDYIFDDINILQAYKRLYNLLKSSEYSLPNPKLFITDEESSLFNKSQDLQIDHYINEYNFEKAYDELSILVPYIEKFLDNVKINVEDKKVMNNRINLVHFILENTFHKIGQFHFVIDHI